MFKKEHFEDFKGEVLTPEMCAVVANIGLAKKMRDIGVQPEKYLTPTKGRIVDYMTHGSADGTYKSETTPAIIARVEEDGESCTLFVINPNGTHFSKAKYSREPKPGHWSWPEHIRGAAR